MSRSTLPLLGLVLLVPALGIQAASDIPAALQP